VEWLLAVAWMVTALLGATLIGRALLLAEQLERGQREAEWQDAPGITRAS